MAAVALNPGLSTLHVTNLLWKQQRLSEGGRVGEFSRPFSFWTGLKIMVNP